MQSAMTIGRLAAAAGVGIETIRYYQRRGLLSTPSLPAGGRRHYSLSVLQQIIFIRRAQELGFTLDEIKGLLAIDGRNCKAGQTFARGKIAELKVRVNELNRMLRMLKKLEKLCEANRASDCPFVRALNGRTTALARKTKT